jgi:hypothetical protein
LSASLFSLRIRGVRRRMRTHFVGIWRGSVVGSVEIVVAGVKSSRPASQYGFATSAVEKFSRSGRAKRESARCQAMLLPEDM